MRDVELIFPWRISSYRNNEWLSGRWMTMGIEGCMIACGFAHRIDDSTTGGFSDPKNEGVVINPAERSCDCVIVSLRIRGGLGDCILISPFHFRPFFLFPPRIFLPQPLHFPPPCCFRRISGRNMALPNPGD
jgi:hypothetical protein